MGGLWGWVLRPPLAPQGMESQGRGWPGSLGLPWGALLGVGFWVLGLPADAVPLQVHVQLRPHVQHFLESLSKTYEVPGAPQNSPGVCVEPGGCCRTGVGRARAARTGAFICSPQIFIFTTAKQDYAEKILDVLDPKKKLIR